MDTVIRVQILDDAVCISHDANILEKSVNPIILLQLRVNSWADWAL